MNNYAPLTNERPNIAVSTTKGIMFLCEKEILYCQAEGNYTHIYLKGAVKNKITVAKSLNRVLESLHSEFFARIHNSYVINLLHVISYRNGDKNLVVMVDGENLPVSRARKESFMKRFKII